MKKFSILFLLIASITFPQERRGLHFGVKSSFDIGRYNDKLELTPSIMNNINEYLVIGAGLTILYYSNRNEVYLQKSRKFISEKIKDKIWYRGGELFVRFTPFPDKDNFIKHIFMQSSIEKLWGNGSYKTGYNTYKYKTDNLTTFIGAGISYDVSEKLTLLTSINFKLNNEKVSPYRNPVIRILLEF